MMLSEALQTRMNLEMAVTDEMVKIAVRFRPADCCLVPENRQELTTEGGLDVCSQKARIRDACANFRSREFGSRCSSIPSRTSLDAPVWKSARRLSNCIPVALRMPRRKRIRRRELDRIQTAARYGAKLGLTVHAGHGLHYRNVQPVAAIARHRGTQHRAFDYCASDYRRAAGGRYGNEAFDVGGSIIVIFGVGIDILRADRVTTVFGKYGEHFVRRILMPEETRIIPGAESAPSDSSPCGLLPRKPLSRRWAPGFRTACGCVMRASYRIVMGGRKSFFRNEAGENVTNWA